VLFHDQDDGLPCIPSTNFYVKSGTVYFTLSWENNHISGLQQPNWMKQTLILRLDFVLKHDVSMTS